MPRLYRARGDSIPFEAGKARMVGHWESPVLIGQPKEEGLPYIESRIALRALLNREQGATRANRLIPEHMSRRTPWFASSLPAGRQYETVRDSIRTFIETYDLPRVVHRHGISTRRARIIEHHIRRQPEKEEPVVHPSRVLVNGIVAYNLDRFVRRAPINSSRVCVRSAGNVEAHIATDRP